MVHLWDLLISRSGTNDFEIARLFCLQIRICWWLRGSTISYNHRHVCIVRTLSDYECYETNKMGNDLRQTIWKKIGSRRFVLLAIVNES